jgi:hypothetical protein
MASQSRRWSYCQRRHQLRHHLHRLSRTKGSPRSWHRGQISLPAASCCVWALMFQSHGGVRRALSLMRR